MRRNGNRRFFNLNNDDETKKMIYISTAVLTFVILAFIIICILYGNSNIQEENSKMITDLGMTNTFINSEEASTKIGKSIEEVKEEKKEESTKIAINTANIQEEKNKNEINEKKESNNITNLENKENKNLEENKNNKSEEEKQPEFVKPVEGEIIKDFAKDTLIYSETLKEWITHMGIDIKANKTTVVKSAEEGTIKSIKNDPRYGITVVIEHKKGYKTIYSNLLTAEFVKEGEKVNKGQTIGTVGNTAIFEIADEPHLHFEIIKDGENVDPNLYLK